MSEFSKTLECGVVVGAGGSFLVRESAKGNFSPVAHYARSPLAPIPRDAAIPGNVIPMDASVRNVLRSGAWTQIISAVIKRVAILVICLWRVLAKYLPVHQNHSVVALARSIEASNMRIPNGAPIETHKPVIVGSVHQCDLPLRERDQPVRFIERLNNRFAFYATLGHDLTSNEIAAFSRLNIVHAAVL